MRYFEQQLDVIEKESILSIKAIQQQYQTTEFKPLLVLDRKRVIAKSIGFVAMIAAWWYIASTENVVVYEMAKPFFNVVGAISFLDLIVSFRKVKSDEINK